MENKQICRACLATNKKMYNMHKSSIITAYMEVTGILDVGDYPYICYECAARLRKCADFRTNCYQAFETLTFSILISCWNHCGMWARCGRYLPSAGEGKVITENVEQERKLKCLESPLTRTNVIICYVNERVEANNEEISNNAKILKKSSNGLTNSRNYINNDLIENEQQEIADNNTSYECDAEITDPHENNPNTEEIEIEDDFLEDKEEKDVEIRDRQLRPDTGDIPLSMLCKADKTKVMNSWNIDRELDSKALKDYTTISLMTYEDAKKQVELRKESNNYKSSIFKCDLCYRGFGQKYTFNRHMKKHDLSFGPYECAFCHIRFATRNSCRGHFSTTHKMKYACKLCPYFCFSSTAALLHMRGHKGVKYTCDLCEEVFSLPNSLLTHKRAKHPAEFVCAYCGVTFVTGKGLNFHHVRYHLQETKNNVKEGPQCAECDIHFATETAWIRHLVLSSKHDSNSLDCDICGVSCVNKFNLQQHLRFAACEETSAFTKYAQRRNPRPDTPCVCEICGMTFQTTHRLVCHQKKHSKKRDYQCDVCDKTFLLPERLKIHKTTHDSSRVFTCDICGRELKSKMILTNHIKVSHLKIRRHKCDICGKAFPSPFLVKNHTKHVHGKVPWPKRARSKRNKDKNLTD